MLKLYQRCTLGAPQLRLVRPLTNTSLVSNNSIFGSLTKRSGNTDVDDISSRIADADPDATNEITPANDTFLQAYIKEEQVKQKPTTETLLTPMMKKLYDLNCKKSGGFYKRSTIVQLPNNKIKYQLKLSKEELEVLEPSIYLQSYRIKSTMKKATLFLRVFRGLDLHSAITQCHFTKKALGREVAELLDRGYNECSKLNLRPEDLYIAQIWTGSDGDWIKRLDIKGRGRHGIIRHRYIHIKCILKSKNVTLKRLAYEEELRQKKKKPWVQLANAPIRGMPCNSYKW